jgi:hypothetical protein
MKLLLTWAEFKEYAIKGMNIDKSAEPIPDNAEMHFMVEHGHESSRDICELPHIVTIEPGN